MRKGRREYGGGEKMGVEGREGRSRKRMEKVVHVTNLIVITTVENTLAKNIPTLVVR